MKTNIKKNIKNKISFKIKTISKNKKAYFDYEILKIYEAGIELKGSEVKALKTGNSNLKGSHIIFNNNELYITGMHISAYKFNSQEILATDRDRKIFLHKKTIIILINKLKEKGTSIIPTKIYLKNNLIKIEVALAKGRKKYDKRNLLKDRDIKRKELLHYKI